MNAKESKIIHALEQNSRATFNQIGKIIGLPAETVKYNFHQLCKQKVIQNCVAIINPEKNKLLYSVYFKLQKANSVRKEEIITFLIKQKNISWVGDLEGNYDLGIIIQTKDTIELNKTLNELYAFFGKEIMRRTIGINSKGNFLPRDYLINKVRSTKSIQYTEPVEETLDELDRNICRILANDARTTAIQIAKENKISTDTAIKRIKKLENRKIIQGYTLILKNNEQNHHKILISLRDYNPKTKTKLKELCRLNNRVIAIIETVAQWDLEIDMEVKSNEQLREFTSKLTNELPDAIKDYDVLEVVNMRKYSFLP